MGRKRHPKRAATWSNGTSSRAPVLRFLSLGLAGGDALGADDHLPGDADQVHVGELAARPDVAVVVQRLDALRRQRVVELGAGAGRPRRRPA